MGIWEWVRGWYLTIEMFLFDRETYRALADFDPNDPDWVEVERPS